MLLLQTPEGLLERLGSAGPHTDVLSPLPAAPDRLGAGRILPPRPGVQRAGGFAVLQGTGALGRLPGTSRQGPALHADSGAWVWKTQAGVLQLRCPAAVQPRVLPCLGTGGYNLQLHVSRRGDNPATTQRWLRKALEQSV